ncbi:MAG: hypothetical protein LKF81_10195 [Prevotella sp.]|jgi:hypothetical protein|nr:hypothetical protein [Prevotella sp.]
MIVTTDIEDIILAACQGFGISKTTTETPIVDDTMNSGLTEEMIIIHAKAQQDGKYWLPSFVEVNVCVPDLRDENNHLNRNRNRLNTLERMAEEIFLKSVAGVHDGTSYTYSRYSIGIEADSNFKCHYVNCRLLFNVLNV